MLGRNMLGDWTMSQRIGRRVSRRLRAMSLGIGLEGSDITPRRSDVADDNMSIWQYGVREDNTPKGSDEVLDKPMTCRII